MQMCDYSQEWARYMAKENVLVHRKKAGREDGRAYGENIYMEIVEEGDEVRAEQAVDEWYEDGRSYSYGADGADGTGLVHFGCRSVSVKGGG